MLEKCVDLRSDTVTKPTPEMRRALAEAEVGDDVFGDDPTVRRLESRVAEILGKEAALFVPSGTMANEVAVAAHTERGDEIILEGRSHIFLFEGGGPALLSGVQVYPLPGDRGLPTIDAVKSAIRPDNCHFPVSRLLVLENTHNRAGGVVLPLEAQNKLCRFAHENNLKTHLDGARIWNAAAASGIPEKQWAESFDSVAVCLSKGLGAPIGSLVAGGREFIRKAHHYRKRFGGGMRQAGILAAAGLYAVDHHRKRLTEDHRRALKLATSLAPLAGISVDPSRTETNMVMLQISNDAPPADVWIEKLKEEGLLIIAMGERAIRLVTHLDIDDEGIERAVTAFTRVAGGFAS
ncbi:MAG: low-specificity L-threonine aldolase [Candidatus Eisenbacteria bacterium]|uniref:Low-specificity L-threonine aldolase n=1 Tax=Eiseniibacteriota bacterium TaxID=2212470 RepID=A0A948S163_UNCEI|nr:low-specificity L-threonine aldolase [Candidatus Eisenbacteria bacterium]MBU1947969.1 low-specificity L-threonine aldolase [Candidatus Eisenbacteria bacterium]MBU2693407.1 low-specificity L-threonine aldolase [Candidatus Eisenbacteria bacterium]